MHIFHLVSALAITAVNSIALYIFGKNPKMRTSQHIYRINLAVADLMIGVFAFAPTMYFATQRINKAAIINEDHFFLELNFSQSESTVLQFIVGFASWLSFLVSVFTLNAASFDRMFAIIFPKIYVKHDYCYVTIGVCVVGWVAAIFVNCKVFDLTSTIDTFPYFVAIVTDNSKRLLSLVSKLVVVVLMVANTSAVILVLFVHNRFVFCYKKN